MKQYYFPHDFSATSDPKIIELITRAGLAGLGFYWIIVEILHNQEDGTISEMQFNSFAKFYGSNQNTLENFSDTIKNVFFEIGLFEKKDGKISCKRVIKNLQEIKDKSLKAKASIEKRRGSLQSEKEEIPTKYERNSSEILRKEKKRKEKKKEEINILKEDKRKFLDFVFLSKDEHSRLLETFGEGNTKKYIDRLNGYIGQIGEAQAKKKYVSHYFTIRNRANKDGLQKIKPKEIQSGVLEIKKEMTEEQKENAKKKMQEFRNKFIINSTGS